MCTDFLIIAADSSAVNGRTMEFFKPLGARLLVRAPGEKFHSPSPTGLDGLTWTAQYGYVGLTGAGRLPILVDGMNTEGLSAGALWMPGSVFPAVTDNSRALALADFVGWVLGSFAKVSDVRAALETGAVQVWEDGWVAEHLPLHFPIHDAEGNSLVVEFSKGEVHLHHNPVAVLTNHPSFHDQLENLSNYVRLSPHDASPLALGDRLFSPHGCGSGLVGLPGDSTPPSRFVRLTYLKQFARPAADATAACALAFHLINTVDIPRGTSRVPQQPPPATETQDPQPDASTDDYTQWAVVKDLTNTVFNMRFYDDMQVHSVDLKTLDFAAAAGKPFVLPSAPKGIDITATLKH